MEYNGRRGWIGSDWILSWTFFVEERYHSTSCGPPGSRCATAGGPELCFPPPQIRTFGVSQREISLLSPSLPAVVKRFRILCE